MTAAHKLCAPLTLVADAVDDTADLDVEWRSQTVIDQYSPEHQFVGALMWLSAERPGPCWTWCPTTRYGGPRPAGSMN